MNFYPPEIQKLIKKVDRNECFSSDCLYFFCHEVIMPYNDGDTAGTQIWFLSKWEYFDGERHKFHIRNGYHNIDDLLPDYLENRFGEDDNENDWDCGSIFHTGEKKKSEIIEDLKKIGFEENPKIMTIWAKWLKKDHKFLASKILPQLRKSNVKNRKTRD